MHLRIWGRKQHMHVQRAQLILCQTSDGLVTEMTHKCPKSLRRDKRAEWDQAGWQYPEHSLLRKTHISTETP